MIHCLHCSAETSNGLALCDLCQRKARLDLEFIPVYFRNLARWRPGRAGSRPVPGSRVLYDGAEVGTGTGDRISDSLDEAANALLTSARELAAARSFGRPLTLIDAVLSNDLAPDYAEALNDDQPWLVALICRGFDHHLTSIATTDWCGDLVTALDEHEAKLRTLTEHAVPGWYAGTCRQVVGKTLEGDLLCGTPTYVVPGLTWVACRGCGMSTYARDHLEFVLDEARNWIAPPMRIAEAIVALVDGELSVPRLHKRISKWGEREQIGTLRRLDADGDEVGPKRFRLGEVIDQLFTEGATRTARDERTATTVG